MKLGELIDEARERCGDTATPYLCSDARFTRLANQAEVEACRRARLLVDSTTDAACKITVVANTAAYALHDSVLFVRQAALDGGPHFLARLSRKDMDGMGPGWITEAGEVVGFVVDTDTQKLRLFRIPEEAGVVHMTVVRLPIAAMSNKDTHSPEIHSRLHLSLVDWMVHGYFSTPDGEMRDAKRAGEALVAFEREFGPPATAIEEQWAAEHYAQTADDGNVYGA